MAARPPRAITVTAHERALLERWLRAGTTLQRVARRARIVLLAADGLSSRTIGRRLAISAQTATLWCERYRNGGAASLLNDAPGRGRKATVTNYAAAPVLQLLAEHPPDGSRWTVRALAEATGVSAASVYRILRARTAAEEIQEKTRKQTAPS